MLRPKTIPWHFTGKANTDRKGKTKSSHQKEVGNFGVLAVSENCWKNVDVPFTGYYWAVPVKELVELV